MRKLIDQLDLLEDIELLNVPVRGRFMSRNTLIKLMCKYREEVLNTIKHAHVISEVEDATD